MLWLKEYINFPSNLRLDDNFLRSAYALNVIFLNHQNSRYNKDNNEMLIQILHSFLKRSMNIILNCSYIWKIRIWQFLIKIDIILTKFTIIGWISLFGLMAKQLLMVIYGQILFRYLILRDSLVGNIFN